MKTLPLRNLLTRLTLLSAVLVAFHSKGEAQTALTHRPYDVVLNATKPGNTPYRDGPSVSATFNGPGGKRITAQGFWDGGTTWRIRFAPTVPGTWTMVTQSRDQTMNRVSKSIPVVAPSEAEKAANPLLRGFLQRRGTRFTLTDGSAFLPVGDSVFQWTEEYTEAELKAWIDVLAVRGMNTLQGCAWLGIPNYNRAQNTPFEGSPKDDRLNIVYFRRLDRLVQYANDRGIMVGLVIGGFPDNSRWWSLFPTRAEDDRWFQYIVRRYAAFNVRWVLYGEVDEGRPSWAATWQEEVIRKAALVRKDDPYKHPIGSHQTPNGIDDGVSSNAKIDYIESQLERTNTQYQAVNALRQRYGKPVWVEEYWYEGQDNDVSRGIANTHRNFLGGLGFPTMGSQMRVHANHPAFPPDRARDQGMELGQYLLSADHGLKRLGHFRRFYANLNLGKYAGHRAVTRGIAARFDQTYAVFLEDGGSVTLSGLTSNRKRDWIVEILDVDAEEYSVRTRTVRGQQTSLTFETGTTRAVALLVRAKP